MDYKEAIQVIKSNYPTMGGFTLLKKALDIAIKVLEKKCREEEK
jgi:hypothetical protein